MKAIADAIPDGLTVYKKGEILNNDTLKIFGDYDESVKIILKK